MNNSQFRKLVLDTPARQAQASSPTDKTAQSRNGATPSALGSRMRSSIPMTPRTIAGYSSTNAFARQLAERNAASSTQTTKKFRSAAAPKGARLADGYTDRSKQLRSTGEEGEEENEKVARVKALEEMMKLQQIDEATFIKLREEILGDEVKDRVGLVKGLDWGLLERVRRGEVGVEDVLGDKEKGKDEGSEEDGEEEDVDDEFEKLEEREVEAVSREREKKKGEMAPPELTGRKRNRDQILADMKAARLAAKEAAAPSLGSKFKKVGERRATSRIERDGKGREVLITVDEQGNEKRKVRRVQVEEPVLEKGHGLLMPNKDVAPLGMEVPETPVVVEEEEDIDIFDGVGDEYDPLAGLDESDSDDEAEKEDGEVPDSIPATTPETCKPVPGSMAPPPRPNPPPVSRNYFGDTKSTSSSSEPSKSTAFTDPTLLAALKKASTLTPLSQSSSSTAEEAAKEARRKKMLQRDDRDAQDMDMGFGSSRFADEEDFGEEKKVKLSEWGSKGDSDEEGKGKKKKRGQEGGGAKKGGGKKKKGGDKDSAADVLKVIAGRKKGTE